MLLEINSIWGTQKRFEIFFILNNANLFKRLNVMNQYFFRFRFLYTFTRTLERKQKSTGNTWRFKHIKFRTCSYRSLVKVFKVFREHSELLSTKLKNWHVNQTEASTYDHKENDKEGSKLYSWNYLSPLLKVQHPQESDSIACSLVHSKHLTVWTGLYAILTH